MLLEDEEIASRSFESSPDSHFQDSGVLLDGSHGALDTQGRDDLTSPVHFLRHRSRSLPPNRRERRRSLRQSLDSTFVFRGAIMVYHAVVELLQK